MCSFSFGFKNGFSFGLLTHGTESKFNLKSFYKLKFKLNFFLLNPALNGELVDDPLSLDVLEHDVLERDVGVPGQRVNMTKVTVAYSDSLPILFAVHGRVWPVLHGPNSTKSNQFYMRLSVAGKIRFGSTCLVHYCCCC